MIINASSHQIPLADGSIHAIVTSPPYFGLRKYEGAQDVSWPAGSYAPMTGCPPCVEVPAMACPFGNEPTVEAYVWHSLLILRECRRVLRDDGVLWLNIGDSFSTHKPGVVPDPMRASTLAGVRTQEVGRCAKQQGEYRNAAVPEGNLLGIPHRVMLAAQADGWTVRNDCVWAKVAPMPESVKGWRWLKCGDEYVLQKGSLRHTRSHEFVFQLVKKMGYYMDDAIFKEMSKMPPSLATERVLLSQEDWSPDFQMQGVREEGSERILSKREGEESVPRMVRDGRQKEANGSAAGISRHGSGQVGNGEIREIGERQNQGQAIQRKAGGPRKEARGDGQAGTRPAVSGETSGLLAQEERGGCGQKEVQEVHYIGEGETSQVSQRSKIQEIGSRFGGGQKEQREAQETDGRSGMYVDTARLDRDSGIAEPSLLLLQEADGQADTRSCNPGEQGRQSHEGEYRRVMPSMQSEEGQSLARRNPRSVLTPPPSAYSGAHFAVFPPELIRPLILSSVPRRCCPKCGAGWAAVVESTPMVVRKTERAASVGRTCTSGTMLEPPRSSVSGSRPTCDCNEASHVPGIVLDPFCGSGTTGEVARESLVRFIGLDISLPYLRDQASWRAERKVSAAKVEEMPLFAVSR